MPEIRVQPEDVGMCGARLNRIKAVVARHIGPNKLSGVVTLIARKGEVVHYQAQGRLDWESGVEMPLDAIMRIYSMTKPIICVALMTLYEQGLVRLTDPLAEFIPAFGKVQVFVGQTPLGMQLADPVRPITIHDLLTHTSGLTYHFTNYGPVEALYRSTGVCGNQSLEDFVNDLAQLPLAFQPGSAWRYSFADDVLARVIEVVSGQSIDAYLEENVLGPLGMSDTAYWVPEDKLDRFASMYGSRNIIEPDATAMELQLGAMAGRVGRLESACDALESAPHNVLRGGHGLVSTTADYYRFADMLYRGGESRGVRILGRKTVEMMTTNRLPQSMRPVEINDMYRLGEGYGLGMSVAMDSGEMMEAGSAGAFGWGGAANTRFWVDPQEDLVGVVMSQFQPNNFHMVIADVLAMVYQSLVD